MLTYKEELEMTLSDAYKDLNGVRPRWFDWDAMTEEDLLRELDIVSARFEEQRKEEEAQQAIAIDRFEARVQATIQAGAKDRETAIRWISDAEEAYDADHLCFMMGIPYGYFRKVA